MELPEKALDLLSELIENYPTRDNFTLKKLIGVGQVRYELKDTLYGMPATAAVLNTKPYSLIFGKKFMTEQVQTLEEGVFVLSHELTHLVLSHFAKDILDQFKDKELAVAATHIIVDCQVNATVYNSLGDDKYFTLLERLYDKEEFPYCMLRPDGQPKTEKLQKVHDKLYSVQGITNEELIDSMQEDFEQLHKENQEKLKQILKELLGNHSEMFQEGASGEIDDLKNELGEFIQKELEQKKKESEEDGKDKKKGNLADKIGQPARKVMIDTFLNDRDAVSRLKNKIKKIQYVSPSSKIMKAIKEYIPKKPSRTVIPNFQDRRTAAVYSTGNLPVFHNNPTKGNRERVVCYIDVSGSQDHVLPHVLPVVSRLKLHIGQEVYCFSNAVSPTRVSDLAKGIYETTGGTDFDPVAEHLLKNKFRKVIILTDGEASLRPDLSASIKRHGVRITVGWTVKNPQKTPLGDIAEKTFFMFDQK